ncbi:MAG: hypothetical protein MUE78_01820, partial [Ilumatobacteraceae bacterium]|nr:hypothetical protein [Ilumatobacteraceae bacterium]
MERRHRAGPADERDLAVAGTTSSPLAPDAATLLLLSSAAGNAAVGSLLRGVQRLPDDELVAEHHTVTPVVSTTPGVATTGSVSETELPGGRTVVGTATDTRVAGVPVARERSVVTEETDEFAVRRAREAGEEVDPDALPTRVVGGTRRTSAVGTTGVTSTTTTTAEEAGGVVDRTRRTTVGPSGVTRARSTTLTETDPAAGTRTTSENAGSTSVGLGGVSSTSTESTSTTNVYGDVESSSTARTTSLTAGGGRVSVGRSRTDVAEERVGDFGTRSERTRTTSASAIHGAEGSGVGLARSMAATTTTGGVELGRRASADGSFTVNVERLDDRDPPRFRITLRVHVGVAAGASAGRHLEEEAAGVTGSGGVSGSVAGDLVYERVYSESEARGYLGDLHQIESGRSADGRPEYGLLARMRAARAAGSATPAAIVSATDARAMREGDAVDLDLSASGDLTLGAGGRTAAGTGPGASPRGSVGVELSGGVTTGRRLRVARSSSAVEVTLTVRASTRASGSGTLGYGVASMTGGMGGSEGESVSMVFRLDPANAEEFDRLFGELSTIMTEEGLRSFAESHPALLRSRTDTASTSSTESIGMGVGPASLSGTTTSTLEASTTRAEGRVTGTRSGSQATTGSLGVGGRTVLSGTHTTGAEATVAASDDDATVAELTATITTSEAETDYAAGLEAVARPFRERRAEDAIAGAVATGPSGLLEQLLNTTTTRLQELDLDTASVDRLIERARERDT